MSWTATRHIIFPLRVLFVFISLSLLFVSFGQEISHKFRRRFGDKSRRATCCGLRPEQYERKVIEELPELAGIVERRSRVTGYIQYFDCTICGQGWVQSTGPEEQEKGLRSDVKKI